MYLHLVIKWVVLETTFKRTFKLNHFFFVKQGNKIGIGKKLKTLKPFGVFIWNSLRKEFEYKKVTQEDKRPILETSLGKKRWSLFPVPLLFSSLSWPFFCCKDQKRPKENKSQKAEEGLLLQQQMAKTFLTHKVFSSSKWRLQNFDLSQRP